MRFQFSVSFCGFHLSLCVTGFILIDIKLALNDIRRQTLELLNEISYPRLYLYIFERIDFTLEILVHKQSIQENLRYTVSDQSHTL